VSTQPVPAVTDAQTVVAPRVTRYDAGAGPVAGPAVTVTVTDVGEVAVAVTAAGGCSDVAVAVADVPAARLQKAHAGAAPATASAATIPAARGVRRIRPVRSRSAGS
jgi:hypothetical protein